MSHSRLVQEVLEAREDNKKLKVQLATVTALMEQEKQRAIGLKVKLENIMIVLDSDDDINTWERLAIIRKEIDEPISQITQTRLIPF